MKNNGTLSSLSSTKWANILIYILRKPGTFTNPSQYGPTIAPRSILQLICLILQLAILSYPSTRYCNNNHIFYHPQKYLINILIN